MLNTPTRLAAILAVACGSAAPCMAQGTQATPNRGYQGWLTDRTEPTFWTWDPASGVGVAEYGQHMRPWLHMDVNDPSSHPLHWYDSTNNYALNQAALDAVASTIAAKWDELGRPTDYAIFFNGWGWKSGLFRHVDDSLVAPSTQTFDDGTVWWRGTPWREESVELASDCLAELIDRLASIPDPDDGVTLISVPAPTLFVFDEENEVGHSCGTRVLSQVFYCIQNQETGSHSGEDLFGDFSLYTSASSVRIDDAFGTEMWPWVQDFNAWPSGSYDCTDWYRFRLLNRYFEIQEAAYDGAIDEMLSRAISKATSTAWDNVKTLNYATSGWFSDAYPLISYDGYGARKPGHSTIPLGWRMRSYAGSTDAQSPVLYSAFEHHRDLDVDLVPPSSSPLEAGYEDAWLRICRMKLDHTLFTLDEGELVGPDTVIPWLPRPGSHIGGTYFGQTYTTEGYARDVMALAKAKGVREGMWWGDEADSAAGTPTELFNMTWKVTDQVWNLNLTKVQFFRYDGGSGVTYTGTGLQPFLFSEEYTGAIQPSKRNEMPAFPSWYQDPADTGYYTDVDARFTLSPSSTSGGQDTYTCPQRLKFIIEILDGGGPWDKGPWSFSDFQKLRIKKPRSGTAPSVNAVSLASIPGATIKELYSTSTRRPYFTSDPNKPEGVGSYDFVFDQEGVGGVYALDNVIDRKTILEITIPLEFELNGNQFSPTDFLDETGHWFEINYALYHTHDLSGLSDTVLPYQVDLFQLYDATPTDATPITENFSLLAGDLNGDYVVDVLDVIEYTSLMSAPEGDGRLDVDRDGDVDPDDLKTLLEQAWRKATQTRIE